MAIRVLPYRQGSASAKALAVAVGGKVLKLTGSSFAQKPDDVVVNWGNTNEDALPQMAHGDGPFLVLNHPQAIRAASNKKLFFQSMVANGDIIPRFWVDRAAIPDDAFPVVCRTVLAGHSGEGIAIAETREGLVQAPLYVEYKKKQSEYRVHVGRTYDERESAVISEQRKARRLECANPNWKIRNHANGFVYARQDLHTPQAVVDAAKRALMATDLAFGAVDVIWNAKQERAYVLEINTAPGLEGQTVADYASFFTG